MVARHDDVGLPGRGIHRDAGYGQWPVANAHRCGQVRVGSEEGVVLVQAENEVQRHLGIEGQRVRQLDLQAEVEGRQTQIAQSRQGQAVQAEVQLLVHIRHHQMHLELAHRVGACGLQADVVGLHQRAGVDDGDQIFRVRRTRGRAVEVAGQRNGQGLHLVADLVAQAAAEGVQAHGLEDGFVAEGQLAGGLEVASDLVAQVLGPIAELAQAVRQHVAVSQLDALRVGVARQDARAGNQRALHQAGGRVGVRQSEHVPKFVAEGRAQVLRACGRRRSADVPAPAGGVIVQLDLELTAVVGRARQHEWVDAAEIDDLEADLVDVGREPGVGTKLVRPETDRGRHLIAQRRARQHRAHTRAARGRAGGDLAEREAALEELGDLVDPDVIELRRVLEAAVGQHRVRRVLVVPGVGVRQRIAQHLEVDGRARLHGTEVKHVLAAHAVDDVVTPAVGKTKLVDAGVADQHVVALATGGVLNIGQRRGCCRRRRGLVQAARVAQHTALVVSDGNACDQRGQCRLDGAGQADGPAARAAVARANGRHGNVTFTDGSQAFERLLDRVGVCTVGQRPGFVAAVRQREYAAVGVERERQAAGAVRRQRGRRHSALAIAALKAAHRALGGARERETVGPHAHRADGLLRRILEFDLPCLGCAAVSHHHIEQATAVQAQLLERRLDAHAGCFGVEGVEGDRLGRQLGFVMLGTQQHGVGWVRQSQRECAAGGAGQIQQLDLVLALFAVFVDAGRRHPEVDRDRVIGVGEADRVAALDAIDRVDAEQAQVEHVVALVAGQGVVVSRATDATQVGDRVIRLQFAQRCVGTAQQRAQAAKTEALHAVGAGEIPFDTREGSQAGHGHLGDQLEVGGGIAIDGHALVVSPRGAQEVRVVQRQLALGRERALQHRAAVHEDLRIAGATDDVLDVIGNHGAADELVGVGDADQRCQRAVPHRRQ